MLVVAIRKTWIQSNSVQNLFWLGLKLTHLPYIVINCLKTVCFSNTVHQTNDRNYFELLFVISLIVVSISAVH